MSDQSQAQPEPTAETPSPESITIPAAEYEATRQQVTEWKERCQRQQAEFENVRKRLRKEAD